MGSVAKAESPGPDGGATWRQAPAREHGEGAAKRTAKGAAKAGSRAVSHWEAAGFFGGGLFTGIAVDPVQPKIIYLASDVSGMYKSVDRGDTWRPISAGLSSLAIASFTIDPSNHERLWAGTPLGLFKSENGGSTWALVNGEMQFLVLVNYGSIAVSKDGRTLLAVVNQLEEEGSFGNEYNQARVNGKLYRSADGGQSWQVITRFPFSFRRLTRFPAVRFDLLRPGRAYLAVSGRGIMRSEDGGLSWEDFSTGLPPRRSLLKWRSMAIGRTSICATATGAGGRPQVYKSGKDAPAWAPIISGLGTGETDASATIARPIAISPKNEAHLFLGFTSWPNLFYRSVDGGRNWIGIKVKERANYLRNYRNAPFGDWWDIFDTVISLAVDPGNEERLYCTTWTSVWRSDDGGETWSEKVAGAQNTVCTDILFAGDTLLSAHMDAICLRSGDNGRTWFSALPSAPKTAEAKSLQHAWDLEMAADGGKVYLGVSSNTGPRVYRSGDGGQTWLETSRGLPRLNMGGEASFNTLSLAADPNNPRVVYAAYSGKGRQLYVSGNAGASWKRLAGRPGAGPGDQIKCVEVDPTNSKRIFAGLYWGGLWRSLDAGRTWKPALVEGRAYPDSVQMIVGREDGTIWGAFADGVYKSTDQGASFARVSPKLAAGEGLVETVEYVESIVFNPDNPKEIFASTAKQWPVYTNRGSVWRSSNGGTDWTEMTGDLPYRRVLGLACRGGYLYAATEGANVQRTRLDNASTGPPPAAPGAGAVDTLGPGGGGAELCAAIHPRNPDIMLLGQDVGGILKSTDGGASWRHVNRGLALPKVTNNSLGIQDLAFSPADPRIVFASTWGGLFRSADGAESWTRVQPPGDGPVSALAVFSSVAVDPGGTLVLAGSGDPFEGGGGSGLYRSTDGGLTFRVLNGTGIPADAVFGRLLIDPDSPAGARRVYAGTSRGLYRSTDGGLSFAKINGGFAHNNVRDLALSRGAGTWRLWLALQSVGGRGGVYRSDDGLNWTRASSGLRLVRGGLAQKVQRLLAHPTDPNVAYVAMRDGEADFGGLFKTTDGGASWRDVLSNNQDVGWNVNWGPAPEGVALASAQPGRLLVGDEAEPLLSDDGGATWRQVSTRDNGDGTWTGTGDEVTYVYDLASSPSQPGRIYAGYEDIGLWRSDNGGASWRQLFWEINIGLGTDGCAEVHLNPADADELYAVAASWSNGIRGDGNSFLLHSSDGGVTWTNQTASFSRSGGRGCAAVDFSAPAASRTLLFAQHGGTVRRSSDGGRSWTVSASGIASGDRGRIFVMAFDPANPRRVYAGTHSDFGEVGSGGGLYRSENGGVSWTKLGAFPEEDVNCIVLGGSPPRLFVGGSTYDRSSDTARGALWASDDGGATFTKVLAQPMVMDVTPLPSNPTSLIAASSAHYFPAEGQNAGLYRSDDNGNTWRRLDLELPHTGILALLTPAWDAGKLYAGTRGDGLKRFALSGAPPPPPPPPPPPGNQPPVLNPIGAQTIAEGAALTLTVTASDPDGDPLTFSAAGLPPGASFDAAARTLAWTPGFTQAGSYTVTFSVSDGALSGSETVPITVTNTNRPPAVGSLSATPNPASTGQGVAFSATASDPDGEPLSYTWDFGDGGSGSGAAPTHTYAQAGTYTVSVIVNDGSASVSGSLPLVVQPGGTSALDIWRMSFRLNFRVPGRDRVRVSGGLPIDPAFQPEGRQVRVDLGGVRMSFTLDRRGRARNANGRFILRPRRGFFVLVLFRGDWAASWADEGLVNAAVGDALVTMPLQLVIGAQTFSARPVLDYWARKDRFGRAEY